jgi:aryl sulfotransferase
MRYEDMCRQPVEAFSGAIRFLGLDDDLERVRRAIDFSSFDALRQQELKHGFKEKPSEAASFFRSGRVGAWRAILTDKQIERLVLDHGAVMRRLGYLSESGCVE